MSAKVHTIKLRWEFVKPVMMGAKCFEIRRDDRGYAVGDLVRFRAVDDEGCPVMPDTTCDLAILTTFERSLYRITYIVRGYGLKEGYVAFGLEGVI